MTNINCIITERFNNIKDSQIPFLADVLDPIKVTEIFQQNLSLNADNFQVVQIKLIRYKPQKRCLIEYHLQGKNDLILIGKIRAKGMDKKSYELQKILWESNFNSNSDDGISVPEPVGIIPQWQMWLQKKVPGEIVIKHLRTNQGITISKKIAQIAHKLHKANIIPQRSHTMKDELAILEQKLPLVLVDYPQWESRIKNILEKCHLLGENTPEHSLCGIHRDFYFDQIITDGNRFYLLDFDLYCQGNPYLDIGNFIGHLTEYSLRSLGNINALQEQEIALAQEFLKLTPEKDSRPIEAYTILTLVRHIYLSNQFPERRSFTEALLSLCEQRLKSIKS